MDMLYNIILIIFSVILSAYIIFILLSVRGWYKAKSFISYKADSCVRLSLVICCRNEQEHLPLLLPSIAKQINNIEQIIFISDHSTDATMEILEIFCRQYSNTKVFASVNEGKKNALKEAITHVDTEYILCTDADCILEDNYFNKVKSFLSTEQPALMIGSVKYAKVRSLFAEMQALEFASLAAVTAGCALAGFPVMCNGANLAFDREVWELAKEHLIEEQYSGDDIFLLHFIKKIKGKITFLKANDSFVTTFPVDTISEFFNQRKRWASKSRNYTDKHTVMTALLVLATNIIILASMIMSIFYIYIGIIFLIKMAADSIILIPFLRFSKQNRLIKLIPVLSAVYPFYIIIATFGGLFGNFIWKQRR